MQKANASQLLSSSFGPPPQSLRVNAIYAGPKMNVDLSGSVGRRGLTEQCPVGTECEYTSEEQRADSFYDVEG